MTVKVKLFTQPSTCWDPALAIGLNFQKLSNKNLQTIPTLFAIAVVVVIFIMFIMATTVFHCSNDHHIVKYQAKEAETEDEDIMIAFLDSINELKGERHTPGAHHNCHGIRWCYYHYS